jgi:hypothetical protein
MENNLNIYFVTFKVFKNDEVIYQTECPRSLIEGMMTGLESTFSKDVIIKIFDAENVPLVDARMIYNPIVITFNRH